MTTNKSHKSNDDFSNSQTSTDTGKRQTGASVGDTDVKSGAEPEAPGSKNADIPGDPNQGTEAR